MEGPPLPLLVPVRAMGLEGTRLLRSFSIPGPGGGAMAFGRIRPGRERALCCRPRVSGSSECKQENAMVYL